MPQQFTTPLCVDLDGSLIETNTLFEATLLAIKKNPFRLFPLLSALLEGKAQVKHRIGQYAKGESFTWLYNTKFLAFLRIEHAKGRKLILATASDEVIATSVAKELGIFEEVIASSVHQPVHASSKHLILEKRFGKQGFSYAGNSHSDLSVWKIATSAIIVHARESVASRVRTSIPVEAEFPSENKRTLKDIVQEIRVHQWLKNLLLFVPAIMAHSITSPDILLNATIGFFSFSFLASSMYVVNDLLDIPSDRLHPTKRMRPIALGTISARDGVILALVLATASALLALLFLPFGFFGMLLIYILINGIYSLRAKRIPYLDIFILAGLFVLRIIAGSAATQVPTSTWLFFFAGCFFFYLASVKRVIELLQLKNNEDIAPGRGYCKRDTELLIALGMLFSLVSCIVLGLYITSTNVTYLYAHPNALWGILPLIIVWIVRIWYLTLTKKMPDDPVLFTSKDIVSYGIGVAVALVLLIATV